MASIRANLNAPIHFRAGLPGTGGRAASKLQAVILLGVLLALSATCGAAGHTQTSRKQEFDSVMQLNANITRGEQLFDTCTACHGSSGTGARDGTVPAIAGQHFRVIAWALVSFRNKQRIDPRMRHFTDQRHLTGPQDVADVAAYVSRLPWIAPSSYGDGERLQLGADVYQRDCSSCHGPKAQGNDSKRYPRLAGQQYEYLQRRLHDPRGGQQSNLSPAHLRLLRKLDPVELTAICDYVSRLNP